MAKAIMVRDKIHETNLSFPRKRESSARDSVHRTHAAHGHGPLDPRFREDDEANNRPTPLRWRCHHHVHGSNIEAWVAASDGLETIAHTRQAEGISARANAEFIVEAVNGYERMRPLIAELVGALELCMETGKLTWAAEQEADAVCRKVKRVMGIVSG